MIRIALLDELKKIGKSLYWLEQETGIDYSTLHRWATKPVERIHLPTLEKICRKLNRKPGDLLVMTDE